MMKRILCTFLSLLISVPAHAAATLDYVGTDGSFNMNGTLRFDTKGKYYQVCYDLNASPKKVWTWDAATGKWNDGAIGSENPAGPTGGQTLAGLATPANYYPAVSIFENTNYVIANFGASSFPSTPGLPSGFSSWNSVAGTTTWNSADKSSDITLSNGDLTATATTSAWKLARGTTSIALTSSSKVCYGILAAPIGNERTMFGIANSTASTASYAGVDGNGISCYLWSLFPTYFVGGSGAANCNVAMVDYYRNIRSTDTVATGKRCIEYTLNTLYTGGLTPTIQIGLANSSHPINGEYLGENNNSAGIAIASTSPIYVNAVQVSSGGTYVQGTTNMVCRDDSSNKAWWYNADTGLWNNDVIANQNPATNTGGVDISALGATLKWALSSQDIIGRFDVTVNFGATTPANSLPTGFCMQDTAVCGGSGARSRAVIIQ